MADEPLKPASRKTLKNSRSKHIILASHPLEVGPKPLSIQWGAEDPMVRGPVIGTLSNSSHRNVIGTHSGSYSVYRALAVATGALGTDHIADLTNTSPTEKVKSNPAWYSPEKIVSIDPFGADVAELFADYYKKGYDIRPTRL